MDREDGQTCLHLSLITPPQSPYDDVRECPSLVLPDYSRLPEPQPCTSMSVACCGSIKTDLVSSPQWFEREKTVRMTVFKRSRTRNIFHPYSKVSVIVPSYAVHLIINAALISWQLCPRHTNKTASTFLAGIQYSWPTWFRGALGRFRSIEFLPLSFSLFLPQYSRARAAVS